MRIWIQKIWKFSLALCDCSNSSKIFACLESFSCETLNVTVINVLQSLSLRYSFWRKPFDVEFPDLALFLLQFLSFFLNCHLLETCSCLSIGSCSSYWRNAFKRLFSNPHLFYRKLSSWVFESYYRNFLASLSYWVHQRPKLASSPRLHATDRLRVEFSPLGNCCRFNI